MTPNSSFKSDVNLTYERLVQLSHLTRDLPENVRELISEVVEAATISLEELQVVVEELQQQNEELLATRREIEVQHMRYRDLFELAPEGYLVTDLKGVIREANQAVLELLGVNKKGIEGKPLAVYVEPGERDRFHRRLDTMLERYKTQSEPVVWQMDFSGHDKSTILAALTVAPERGAAGELSGLRWLLRDLTATRQAKERERLLAEITEQHESAVKANRLLETLIGTMPSGVVIVDADGKIQATNAADRNILSEALTGDVNTPQRSYSVYYPDGTPMPDEDFLLLRAAKKGETIRNAEFILRWPDKEDVAVLASAAPVLDETGKIVSAVSTVQDITHLKRAMDALEVERSRLKTIIENTPTGIIVADKQGAAIMANPAAYALYGQAIRIGQLVRDGAGVSFCHLDGTPFDNRDLPIARSALDGETIIGLEIVVTHPDGQRFDLLANASPIRDKDGHVQGSVSALRDITEIKRFMSALETEQARLKAIIENVPAGIVVSNTKAEISLINPAFDRLYQKIRAESRNGVSFCRADGTPYTTEEIPFARSAIAGEVIAGEEMSIVWPNGERTDLLVNSAPIPNNVNGEPTAVGTFQDITDIKETQRTLQLYAERLRVLNNAGRVILASESVDEIVDAVLPFLGQLMNWLRASVSAFDFKKNEIVILGVHANKDTLLGKGVSLPMPEGWPPPDLAEGDIVGVDISRGSLIHSELVQKLHAEGVNFLIMVPLLAHDELLGVLSMSFAGPTNLTLEQQEIVRQIADGLAIGIWQASLQEDLRRHAGNLEQMVARRTAALKESEARFRIVFDALIIGIALLTDKGEIIAANPALQRMLGYGEDELVGTPLADCLQPDEAKEEKKLFRQLAGGKLDDYVNERRYANQDGTERWCELTVCRVQGPSQNRRVFAIAMIRDITQRKVNQEALVRSERLTIAGRLGASLAHEINNPLQSVIGCLGLAEEMLEDKAASEVFQYLNIAMEELERAAGIVTQLRDLSRGSEAAKEPVDVNALVEKALLLTKRQYQDHEIDVEWTPAAGLPSIDVVPSRIQQVFLNLLLNAAEVMPEGGCLTVQTVRTRQPKGIRITFADTGVGIPPDRLKHIFEPFQTTRSGGLGLGLYISKNIMEDHGGSIEVTSKHGKGTTFTLRLPG